jgi:multiple sugar transport system substrate-binding protein
MRRPRPSLRVGALLAVTALALTACAGSSDDPAAPATSSGPP